ncbi:MCE family protein [Williamsia sp. DF01-3]|uniref:MCE family protein n=1 Tax=Williamsia sp. DF01-3 TaxID=2934157 RepID=UPI001FF57ACF|nr:MCE family protein [Williamsia sp. DF01-3]MCK0520135.1 MCE family protein [Williamsia sp. DF01-3]
MAVSRERAFRATVIKLGSFAVVMVLIFVVLVVVFSQYRGGSSFGYKATFTSASQLKSGSKVRIAGVEVGKVGSVGLNPDNEAVVEFDVNEKYRLPKSARALIRYENLTGDRFLEIQEGTGDPSALIGDGGSIPIGQTEPALDLDKLLGGFKPLFRTLNPEEVNELSASLIQVFQGQGPALSELLRNTATFTDSLADRDQLIGQVIDNLNTTLGTIDADNAGFDSSLDQLQLLISGLDSQRNVIGEAVTNASEVTNDLNDVLATNRADLKSMITATGEVSDEVLKGEPYVRGLISRLPGDFKALSNLGSYGAWLQIWLCQVNLIFTAPGGQEIVWNNIDTTGVKQNPGGRCDPR